MWAAAIILSCPANVRPQGNVTTRQPRDQMIVLREDSLDPVQSFVRLGEIHLELRLLCENELDRSFNIHLRFSYECTQAITKLVTSMFSRPSGSRNFQPNAIS